RLRGRRLVAARFAPAHQGRRARGGGDSGDGGRADADVAPAEQAALAEPAAVFLLLEEHGGVAIGGEAHLVALDLGDEAARDIMVMAGMRAAVRLDQLDPVA